MDLESLAVEFVTSHCQQCDKRIPVRMPNIDELVVQRSRARNTAEDVQRREEGDARTAAAYRTELRLSLRNGASRFVVAALEILDEMDAEPVPGDGRLLSLAKTEPSSFTDPVVSALITFGMTNADRASLALPVLDILSIYTKDTASIALLASNAENELRTKHISTVATTTNLDDQQIDSAVSLLINMVAPFSWPHPTPLGDPSRFIEFFDRYPDRVKFRIRVLLQGDQPLRGMAAKALALLARHRDQLIEWSLPELARAWYLTSDQFDPSTAPVRWALADLLVHHPVKADEAIDKTRTRSTPDLSSDWLKVYYAALHRVEYDDTTRAAPELPIVATKRLFSELEKPPSEEDLRTLTELLRWMRDHHIGVLAPSHMRLLGIALRLSDAINELESSGRLWGKQLVGLNLENATHAVQQLCADVLKATARAAAETGASAVVTALLAPVGRPCAMRVAV